MFLKPKSYFSILLMCLPFLSQSQNEDLSKTRFVAGLSYPELIHLGANVAVGNYNQIGGSVGFLVFYGYHPTVNIEHRFYFENLKDFTKPRNWFFRQAVTYYFIIDDEIGGDYQASLILSVGLDFRSNSRKNGWTLDLGGFIAYPKKGNRGINENHIIGPSLRIQFYSYFKKNVN